MLIFHHTKGKCLMLKYFLVAVALSVLSIPSFAEQPFICRTNTHTVIVDYIHSSDSYRYRSWKKHKSTKLPPDLIIPSGAAHSEGMVPPCRYTVWTFMNKGVEYRLEEVGCGDAPKNAIGQLFVTVPRKKVVTEWCVKN
jgi:hypothetical protein